MNNPDTPLDTALETAAADPSADPSADPIVDSGADPSEAADSPKPRRRRRRSRKAAQAEGQGPEDQPQAEGEAPRPPRRQRQAKAPKPVIVPLAPVREGAEVDEQYKRSFTPEEIGAMPLTAFVGKIIFVESDRQLHQAMKALLDEELLGFDTETRPIFRKGAIPPPALLQLCGSKNVYIFQLAKLEDKAVLAELLAARHIVKSGVSVRDDLKGLKAHFEFTEHGFVDLGDVARKMGMLTHGLRNLTANLMGQRISKGAQCSNWAREALSTKQIVYAATDAWISRELYLRFVDLGVL